MDAADLDRAARGGVHQGVVAEVEDAPDYGVADLVRGAAGAPLIVVLDGVEDPHNFGAILRVADAAGVDGVVRQTRQAAALDGVAAKASAGAIAHVRIANVVNIARAVEELKEADVWTVGLAGDADAALQRHRPDAADGPRARGRRGRAAAAGPGAVRPAGRDPDAAATWTSLNVSVAAGIVLFEAVRQRAAARGKARMTAGCRALAPWHAMCYIKSFRLAGVAQSGRAADL